MRKTSAFWSARRKQHALPGRQDIDPIDLGAKLLPWIFLTDVVDLDAGMDFRFRLAGTSNVRLIGIEPRRRLVSDVFATDGLSFMMAGYRDTVTERAATFWYGRTSGGLRSRSSFKDCFSKRPTANVSIPAFYYGAGDDATVEERARAVLQAI